MNGSSIIWILICFISATKSRDIENLLRDKRHLVYPNPLDSETKVQVLFGLGLPMEGEVSMTLGYVLKCNYDLPHNASDYTQEYVRYAETTSRRVASRKKRDLAAQAPISRWEFYRMLETALGTDKVCLLRAVCEAADEPFLQNHGLLGEFLHVIFTPSITSDEYQVYSDREYHAAEIIGRSFGNCRTHFECPYNPLDYFTRISTLSDLLFEHYKQKV